MNNYLYLKVEGKNIDKFLLKCSKCNINIIKIKYNSYKSIYILINEFDYKKIQKYRYSYKIKVVNIKGIIKYKLLLKKYVVSITTFFISVILLLFLSNIIFDIDIVGSNTKLNRLILKELSNNNIDKFKFKKNYKEIESIKRIIKNKFTDNIEWIEINEKGTKYIVKYVERKKEYKNTNNKIYSIVSKKNGIVKDIYTISGISLVDIDNYVSKGDILISSDILLNEEVKNRIDAEGKVYAETWYKVNIEYPLNYLEKRYTNKKRTIPYIKIGNKYYELFKFKKYYRKNRISYLNQMINIKIGIENIYEIKEYKKTYNVNTGLKEANKLAKEKILLRLNDDEHIISQKTLKFYSKGSKIIVDIFFSVYEEIGEKRIIEMGEIDDTKNVN